MCTVETCHLVNKLQLPLVVSARILQIILAKLESDNQRRLGSAISLPFFVILGILGFGSPVFFSAISETSLENVGDGTKTLDEEMVRQLRQNNLGPAEMLLPLTSVDRREEYANTIRIK